VYRIPPYLNNVTTLPCGIPLVITALSIICSMSLFQFINNLNTQLVDMLLVKVKVKFPILVTEHWVPSWSQFTDSKPAGDFLSHPLAVDRPSTSTKLYCLVEEARRSEQLAEVCYAALSQWKLNPWRTDRKSNALPLCNCSIFYWWCHK